MVRRPILLSEDVRLSYGSLRYAISQGRYPQRSVRSDGKQSLQDYMYACDDIDMGIWLVDDLPDGSRIRMDMVIRQLLATW